MNDPPVLDAVADQVANEGATLVLTVTASDVDSPIDSLTYSLDFAPAGAVIDPATGEFRWTPADDASPLVTVRVADSGTPSLSDVMTFRIDVANVAPVVDAGPDGQIVKSGTFASSGSFIDPGADTWTAAVDYGDGSGVQTLALSGKNFSLSHAYAEVGTYTVTVTVTDDDGGTHSDTVLVHVYYIFGGFLPPLSNTMSFATGRTIPVKFQLRDAVGSFVSDLSAVTGICFAAAGSTTCTPANPAGNTSFRYDTTDNQYVFNWQTKGQVTAAGDHDLVVTLKDGTQPSIRVRFVTNGGSAKLTAEGAGTADAMSGALLAGDVALLVDNSGGQLDGDELARNRELRTRSRASKETISPPRRTLTETWCSASRHDCGSMPRTGACAPCSSERRSHALGVKRVDCFRPPALQSRQPTKQPRHPRPERY